MSLINLFIIIVVVLIYYLIHYIFDANVSNNNENNINKKNRIIITNPVNNINPYTTLNKSSSHSNRIVAADF